jgi:DNA-binding NarL/FixJ family response regulator
MTGEHRIRVLISSRYGLFRTGLRALLEHGLIFHVLGEANTTRQTVRFAQRLRPDVVLIDAGARGLSGPETARLLKNLDPNIKVVVLTATEQQITDCLSAGASAYVRKGAQAETLKAAIYNVCKGKTFAA